MAGVPMDTLSTASAMLKTVFDDGVVDCLPDNELISKLLGYKKFERLGAAYQTSVNLSYGHSVTACGNADQVISLGVPDIVPLVNATATSYVFVYRDMITNSLLARAVGANEQSFESAMSVSMERARKSFTKIQEEIFNYGMKGLGRFTAATADLAVKKVQVLLAEFAPAIWIASKAMPIDIYTTAGVLVLQTAVTGMADLTNRKLTLDSVTGLSDGTSYDIYRRGFRNLEPPGLQTILDTATTLFGIAADGTYDLWTPNTYSLSSASLLFSKIARGVATYRPKGLAKDLTLVISEDAFPDAIPDYNTTVQTNTTPGPRTARWFQGPDDTMKLVHGTEDLKYVINTSTVHIQSSPYQKNGYAPLIESDSLVRIGSQEKEFTFQDLGGSSGQPLYFRTLDNMNAVEFRLQSDMALFTSERNRSMLFTGIVNNTAA